MLTVSQTVVDSLNKSISMPSTVGCWLEYNMNDLIDGVSISNTGGDTTNAAGNALPFQKLFPIKTIIDPRRPKFAGIKYYIFNASVPEYMTDYAVSKELSYRLYYPGEKTQYKYWVSKRASGTSLSGCQLVLSYPEAKTASANKITIKFETSHCKPGSWTVKLTSIAGVETIIATNAVVPDNGVVDLYYDGAAWSTTEFSTPSSAIDIKMVKVDVTSVSVANEYIGVIEVSPKLVVDITDRIVGFTVTKQSSNGSQGITPVGDVTANSLSIDLNCYDMTAVQYDKTFAFDKSKINLYKNIIIRPFTTINGSTKIPYGVFYAWEFTVGEFGETNITALDGAISLQQILAPDILISNSPSQAIIRRLLDGVGFTNYKFNTTDSDTSSITPYYFYTDSTKTVWDHIQDLCRDTQMIAVFDEYDVLQFYTREYLFQNKATSFKFRYNTIGENLSNIISFSKSTVPSAKAVKIRYTPQYTASSQNSADFPYQSPLISLGAAALTGTLLSTTGEGGVINTEPVGVTEKLTDHTFYNKAGYLVINKEIIEYDAIKYTYKNVNTNALEEKWITSDSDITKYTGIAAPNSFTATGQFRIKKRNAFGTLPAPVTHDISLDTIKSNYTTYVYDSATKSSSLANNLISLESTDSSAGYVPRSMLTVNSNSTTTPSTKYTIASTNAKVTRSGYNNFVVGTSFFFPAAKNSDGSYTSNQISTGGIAFCLNSDSTEGYILSIGTVQSTSNKDLKQRVVKMLKIKNGVMTVLQDTQSDADQFQNIVGGQLYKVDVKVSKATNQGATFAAFKIIIDNTEINAIDNSPLAFTDRAGLVSNIGVCRYDYLYSSPITDDEFVTTDTHNIYSGFLGSSAFLVKQFGDFALSKTSVTEDIGYIEEFGPVARELLKVSTRFERPSIPRYPVITMNPYATLIGSSIDSFGMEAYVLNNSGTYIKLDDGNSKHFNVVGDSIIQADQWEYLDPTLTNIDKQEQVAFDSVWIQKESEAKALSDWMKNIWSKQQQVIQIEVFANPLIQIGDTIEISYPNNGLYSTEDTSVPSGYTALKYIVLDIEQTWQDGPATKITARSIYVN